MVGEGVAEGNADIEVRAVAGVYGGAEPGEEAQHRRVSGVEVRSQGVGATAAGLVGGVPGQQGADAAALVGVGDLQSEIDDARFVADEPGRDHRERTALGVEADPDIAVVQQPGEVAMGDSGPAPAQEQVRLGAVLVEGIGQGPVRLGRWVDRGEGRLVDQGAKPCRAISTAPRR